MSKIYVVSAYSQDPYEQDIGLCGLFSTFDRAQAWINKHVVDSKDWSHCQEGEYLDTGLYSVSAQDIGYTYYDFVVNEMEVDQED